MEGQFISFYKYEVTLEIWLEDDLTSRKDLFGAFTISTGKIGDEDAYWDNISFFIQNKEKVVKKDCKSDIKKLGLKWKDVYADIMYLIKKAQGLGYL